MKIGLQFAMPAEFHALPGAKELEHLRPCPVCRSTRLHRGSLPAPAVSAR